MVKILLISFTLLFSDGTALAAGGLKDVTEIDRKRVARRKVQSTQPRKKGGGVGKGIANFGEEVASRLDRIVQRKAFDLWGDPWTLQGIPLILPSGRNGFHLGLRVAIQNIRRQDPHLVQIEAQVLASDKGRYKHLLGLDFPRAFGGKYRISTRVSYDRDISLNYFGIGNGTSIDFNLFEQNDVIYRHVREGPSLQVQILRYLGKYVRVGPIFGFKQTDVEAPTGSLLDRDRPLGFNGGQTPFVGIAFVHDTLDFEPYPTSGGTHELFFAAYPRGFSDFEFYRTTYTYRRFTPVHRSLTFAHRTLLEVLTGDVPFFELSDVGGARPSVGYGGDQYFRGFASNRFIDKIRFNLGFELRWDPIRFEFANQQIKIGFVPFFDFGRVWADFLPVKLGDWHASTGWGIRMIWDNRFIIRGDFAVTNDRTSFYVELGNSF